MKIGVLITMSRYLKDETIETSFQINVTVPSPTSNNTTVVGNFLNRMYLVESETLEFIDTWYLYFYLNLTCYPHQKFHYGHDYLVLNSSYVHQNIRR